MRRGEEARSGGEVDRLQSLAAERSDAIPLTLTLTLRGQTTGMSCGYLQSLAAERSDADLVRDHHVDRAFRAIHPRAQAQRQGGIRLLGRHGRPGTPEPSGGVAGRGFARLTTQDLDALSW